MLNGLEKINFSDYASCHFTLSNDYSIEINKFLIHYRKSVVNYLQNAIVDNYNVSDIFGRGFNKWAKAFNDSYVDFAIHNNRYYWLNLTHNNRIEIRLFKFDGTNATQLLNAFKWFKTFMKIDQPKQEQNSTKQDDVTTTSQPTEEQIVEEKPLPKTKSSKPVQKTDEAKPKTTTKSNTTQKTNTKSKVSNRQSQTKSTKPKTQVKGK